MFQNISFTFLCSLAFISWTVLCYLHIVEEEQMINDYNVELYTEQGNTAEEPQYCPYITSQSTETNYISRGYELLVSYGLILAFTAFLSKLLQWVEQQSAAYIERNEENIAARPSLPFVPQNITKKKHLQMKDKEQDENQLVEPAPPEPFKENAELRDQLNDLQLRCRELIQELRAVNNNYNSNCNRNIGSNCNGGNELRCNPSNSSFGGSDTSTDSFPGYENDDNNSGVVMWKQPASMKSSGLSVASDSMTRDVFVTYSHIHININGPVHVSQQDFNTATSMIRPRNMAKRSEFLQVWGNFIQAPEELPMLTGINNILI